MAEASLRLSLDGTAVPVQPVGAGQYTLELGQALAQRSDVDLVVLTRTADAPRWRAMAPGAELVADAPGPRPLRLAWEQLRLPGLLARSRVAVHHGPHYTMPERSPVPMVVTVHDMSFFETPAWHQRSKVLLFRRAIALAARRAAAVVCPSQTTAAELRRWCRVEAAVFVAHHGVDLERFRPDEPDPRSDPYWLRVVDHRLGDGRPYLLFVGTLEPRKDVPSLVRAFDRVSRRHPDALLVVAGGDGWGAEAVGKAIEGSAVADRIVRTGYVADAAVPALLRSATASVYPALYEGFGLPALEALACGTPLITTSGTAMEEVAQGAAVLVGPGDTGVLADAIDEALAGTNPVEADQRRSRGLEVAAAHTWEASAEAHVAAYRHAVGPDPSTSPPPVASR